MTSGAGRLGQLEMTVSFWADEVVVSVLGDVDLVTAPDLNVVLAAVLERGPGPAVVDLADTHFMGVAGLRVLEAGAERLAACGRRLTIRSPSVLVSRMLDISGLAEIVNIQRADQGHGHLGPEQTAAVPGTPVTEAGGLTRHLRRVTSIPADDDVVDGALSLVVALARATVGGADGVSVSLQRHGQLMTVAASDQTILDMDAYQYASGEGPCVDASVEGRWFHAEALDQETRWPAFTPKARSLDINAILSSPLLAEDRPVGALNIYSRTAAAFAAEDQELASVFATEASRLLSKAGAGVTDDQLSDRLALALRTRRSIAHAQGVLMEREGIGAQEAYTLLRTFSRETNQPLRERAADIAGSTRRLPPSPAPEQKEGPCSVG